MVENNIDKSAMELSELLPLLQQKLIKPFEQLSKSKLSPMQFHVLFILEEQGDLSMTELSKKLLTSKQQMTPIIDKLIIHGFVERKHNELDRRIIKISLSSSGKRYIEKMKIDIFDMLKNKFQSLNDDDLSNLYKAFVEIKSIINKLP
jgi:MarR family transcriptional regulator, organic hydroperoxide resistance regulator